MQTMLSFIFFILKLNFVFDNVIHEIVKFVLCLEFIVFVL
jgi:hypothetical protein